MIDAVVVDEGVGGMGKRGLACGAILALLALPVQAADEIKGEANVVSGNEIVVGKKTVRLFGMSAPDLKETCEVHDAKIKCGIVAWAELIKLADGQLISCDKEELPADAPGAADKSVECCTCYIGAAPCDEAMGPAAGAPGTLNPTPKTCAAGVPARWNSQTARTGRLDPRRLRYLSRR